MTATTLQTLFILLGLVALSWQVKMMMPKEFVRCRRNDTKIDICLRSAIQDAIPVLVRGMPKLNVLSIDPMEMTEVNMVQNYGPVNIVLNLTNFNSRNLGRVEIIKVKSNVDNYLLDVDVKVPGNLTVSGHYGVQGNVFILPIQGDGDFTFWLEDVVAHLKLIGERRDHKGTEYMNLKKFFVDFNIKHLRMKLDNLFDGDQVLGKYANDFLNQFSADIFEQLKPLVDETVGLIFRDIATRFYDRVPYNQIYL